MLKLKWINDVAKLNTLIPCEDNPRVLTDKQRVDLKKSLEKFSLAEVPIVDLDNKIIAGHQRIDILKELYGSEYQIDIRRPSRKLTDKEYQEYLIRSNKNTGEWDIEKLNLSFDTVDLKEWGFNDSELIFNIEVLPLNLDDDDDENEEGNNKQYKIEVKFANDMDMMDLYDDLISKGYLARIVK